MEGNDVLKRCAACDEQRPRDAFSGKQWGAKAQRRRCTACVASGAAPRPTAAAARTRTLDASTIDESRRGDGAAPDGQGTKGTCEHCGAPAKAFCKRCCVVAYCSVECQRADWKAGHKASCVKHADEALAGNEPSLPRAQQRWISTRLNPLGEDPRTRAFLSDWMFERRSDEGSVASCSGYAEKGFLLQRKLVVFVDIDKFRVRKGRITSSELWFTDLAGLRATAKRAVGCRQTRQATGFSLAHAEARNLRACTAAYNRCKQLYDETTEKVGGRYLGFAVVFSDSNPKYATIGPDGAQPDAMGWMPWTEATFDRWTAEMVAAGKVVD